MEKRNISRTGWKLMLWIPILIGTLMFVTFNTTFFIPGEYITYVWLSSFGFLLVGWGFGLAYAKLWKIKGIDY